MAPAPEFAVVHLQPRLEGLDSPGVGYAVEPPFRQKLCHLFGTPHRVGSLQPEAGQANVRTDGDEQRGRIQLFRKNEASVGIGLAPAAGQRDARPDLDVRVAGQVHPRGIRHVDNLPPRRLLERIQQLCPVGNEEIILLNQLIVSLAAADGIAGGVRVGPELVVRQQCAVAQVPSARRFGGLRLGRRRRLLAAAGRNKEQQCETGNQFTDVRCHCQNRS